MARTSWKEFEEQCTQDLSNRFDNYAKFKGEGQSDSTVSDILVKPLSGKEPFYIEVKQPPSAQCGQFVLVPDTENKVFTFSKHNKSEENQYTRSIMNYMNKNFDQFERVATSKEKGKTGEKIEMGDKGKAFINWIVDYYTKKGSKLFMTKTESNGLIIFPISDMGKYFDVTAKYRIKKSGSGKLMGKRREAILNHLSKKNSITLLATSDIDGLFVRSLQAIGGQKFILNGDEYIFSQKGEKYEVRRLSNTWHANVIFTVRVKEEDKNSGWTDEQFIDFLQCEK